MNVVGARENLKKANTTLAQELKECKTILAETSKTLRESFSVQDSCLVALQNKQTEFEKYKAFNDHTVDYDKLELVKEKHDELKTESSNKVTLRRSCQAENKGDRVELMMLILEGKLYRDHIYDYRVNDEYDELYNLQESYKTME
nr:hypothetical protein [Tanacetum cinerariifolium]